MLAGLLAVDPHRLFLYWDVCGLDGLTMTLHGGGACCEPRKVAAAGGLYMSGLAPDRPYRAEFAAGGHVVLQSNEIVLPPDRESVPEALSSASLHP